MDCTTTFTGRFFLATKAKVFCCKRVPVAETKNRNYSIGKSEKEREKLIQISQPCMNNIVYIITSY